MPARFVKTSARRPSRYVPASVGLTLVDAMAAANPGEVCLNPGSGSRALREAAQRLGLNVV